jgi:hypothetical protein
MKRSSRLVLALLLLAVVMISVTMAGAQEPTSPIANTGDFAVQTSSGAVVRAGSGMVVPPGGTVMLPVEAMGVQDLGAATVMVGYDPTRLQAVECQRNPEFDLGMYNLQFDQDDNGVPDAVRFNVISMNGLSATEEVPLNLADITWAVVGEACLKITSTLEVEVLTFTDPVAIPINVSAEDGGVMIGTDLVGDLDCDCDVDVADVMMVAGKWRCQLGDACYDAHCDLDGDGGIDIVDIMQVAAHWGELCSP